MIVAVDDFNMGAMENKGLNIFNSRYVLASPETATDGDYKSIEAIIAHEYFHNWTGNRITCRDWFQLLAQGGADGLPRPAVLRRHALGGGQAHRGRDPAAGRAVPRGRGAAGASGAAERIRRDQQLLHGDGLREGRRGHRDAAPAGRAGDLAAGARPLLRAARRAGLHHRGLAEGVRGRLGPRPRAVQALVRARPARRGSRSTERWDGRALHARRSSRRRRRRPGSRRRRRW